MTWGNLARVAPVFVVIAWAVFIATALSTSGEVAGFFTSGLLQVHVKRLGRVVFAAPAVVVGLALAILGTGVACLLFVVEAVSRLVFATLGWGLGDLAGRGLRLLAWGLGRR